MLIHITPTIFLGKYQFEASCELLSLTVNELNLTLVGGKDLATRRPYPNRHYLVACRNIRKTAVSGILIDSPETLGSFTVVNRWLARRIDGEGQLVSDTLTHACTYVTLDREYDAVSDEMTLWYGSACYPEWQSRWPVGVKYGMPISAQPRMDICSEEFGGLKRSGDVADVVEDGRVLSRTEVFQLPTVEPGRLLSNHLSRRMPGVELAFKASQLQRA